MTDTGCAVAASTPGVLVTVLGVLALTSSATSSQLSDMVRAELAPTGSIRVGINFGNVLLAGKDPQTGDARGIAVDLARELGRRLGATVSIVAYDSAGRMADGAREGAWDVAFLGTDPGRADQISFTAAYLEIDATYLVPPGSPLRTIADVDRDGIRIAVSEKSAYDLFLSRELRRARLVRTPGVDPSTELFIRDRLEALAGLRPVLVTVADRLPGSRVLDGRFTSVQQAVGTPRGRNAAARYLRAFVEDVKASGLVAAAIERHGIRGVSVAPKAAVP
jgi:polar amino acid transport system substrate-binding protein